MSVVKFPGLGLEYNISRVAFRFLGIEVYWYAILICIAILIFLLFSKKVCNTLGIRYTDVLDLIILVVPIAFFSARVYYVIFSWEYYASHITEILNIRDGGLAIYGGIIGGAITVCFFCRAKKVNILDMTDLIAPFLILGQAIGRWGNFFNIEAYGTYTNLPWRMEIIENGIAKSVHPTFLYESLLDVIIFAFLMRKFQKRKFKGEITYLYIILYSFVRIWIEQIRIDSLMFFNVKVSQILSALLFVIFCGILAKKKKHCKNINNSNIK